MVVIKEQKSGWWVAYKDLGVMRSYRGSYRTKQSATQNHPNARVESLKDQKES